jgi:hypothetical protein
MKLYWGPGQLVGFRFSRQSKAVRGRVTSCSPTGLVVELEARTYYIPWSWV